MAAWLVDNHSQNLTEELHTRGRGNISAGFGDKMTSWLLSDTPKPYQSWGNGSAMRVSPVALWARDEDELLHLARESALPTHDSEQARLQLASE